RDPLEVAGRPQVRGVGLQLEALCGRGGGPLAGQRRRRADDRDPVDLAAAEELAGEDQRRPRLARTGRRRDQEGAAPPALGGTEGPTLPCPQRRVVEG